MLFSPVDKDAEKRADEPFASSVATEPGFLTKKDQPLKNGGMAAYDWSSGGGLSLPIS
jgi:hypothetical protein